VDPPHRAEEGTQPYGLRVLGTDRIVPLEQCRLSIGTARNNVLVLPDPYVSKRHCTLVKQTGGVWIVDEGSRNGTWVNCVRIDRCEVSSGARIVLGRTQLQVVGPVRDRGAHGIVGEHASMKRVLAEIERFGPTLRPVLLLGETGTGKELVARALHESSPSRLGPYEPLNCGAIPRDLAEAEIFGHVEGAFTGASRARRGAFERADGGTLFLDEVGEMPLELQAKLLRVLEEGFVQRVGDERRRPVTVRLIAATHRDLPREMERGRFRLDLYHRLAVGVVQLPALRERVEDIPLLAEHFLQQTTGEGTRLGLDESAIRFLQRQSWKGNVRELRNAIHRAVVASAGGPYLRTDDFEFLLDAAGLRPADEGAVACVGRHFQDIRREAYLLNIRACGGNRSAAAVNLGIPKSTFFDQLKELGIP
jgi:DNA-binding NtrC family response regulator